MNNKKIGSISDKKCKKCKHRLGVHTVLGYCTKCNKDCVEPKEIIFDLEEK